jgi:predicted PurR-regulated permease PerM
MNLPPPTEKQARIIWFSVTGLAIGILVALLVALVWGLIKALQLLSPVLWPIAVAGVLAYLLDPVVDFLERKGVKRTRAIVSVFLIALLLVGALFASVVPQVIVETRQLATRIPTYTARLEKQLNSWLSHPPALVKKLLQPEPRSTPPASEPADATPTLDLSGPPAGHTNNPSLPGKSLEQDTLQTATGWAARVLPALGSWLFGQVGRVASWFGVLAALALVPVYTFYFLVEKQGISSRWTDYLPVADSRFKSELVFVLRSINGYLISFFRGQVLVAICDGILYATGFLMIGLPYAVLIGAVAVVLTMIPFLGAIVTCSAALVIALVQFGDWLHPLLVLAVFGCVQALEGLVISPKIMGQRVGLHPVTIIIAVMTGTAVLGGLLGGILAIPLTAALRVLMFRYVWKRHQGDEEETA